MKDLINKLYENKEKKVGVYKEVEFILHNKELNRLLTELTLVNACFLPKEEYP